MVHAYRSGEGVPEDLVEALAWSIVSDGPGGGEKRREATRALERSMTPEQVRRARERAEELVKSVAEGEKVAKERFDLTQKEIAAHDLKVYTPLAEQGIASAQTQLGIIHSSGRGVVPVDRVEACAWWTLAAEGGDRDADRYLRDARQELTTEALGRVAVRAGSLRSQIAAKKKAAR
jgi:TPR repeat protein